MHEVLVNRLGGLSLPRKSVVRLTDRPDMTLDVYRGRKTTKQQQQQIFVLSEQTRRYTDSQFESVTKNESGRLDPPKMYPVIVSVWFLTCADTRLTVKQHLLFYFPNRYPN